MLCMYYSTILPRSAIHIRPIIPLHCSSGLVILKSFGFTHNRSNDVTIRYNVASTCNALYQLQVEASCQVLVYGVGYSFHKLRVQISSQVLESDVFCKMSSIRFPKLFGPIFYLGNIYEKYGEYNLSLQCRLFQ